MRRRVVVVGAGGFGRETLDVVQAAIAAGRGLELVGVVDSGPAEANLGRLAARSIRYLGTEAAWLAAGDDADYLVAVGSPAARRAIVTRFDAAGVAPATAIHPGAVLGSAGSIGAGVVVCAGVQISTNVTLGDHVHVGAGTIIGHDSVLRDVVSVNPGAIVSGDVVVEPGVLIGAGATVLQGLRVGTDSTVGAMACVVHDVPAGTTVKGVPAR